MIINFPHKKHCIEVLHTFVNEIKQHKEIYSNNENINNCFINIKKNKKCYDFLLECIKYSSNILTNKNNLFMLSIFCNSNHTLIWNICILTNVMFDLPFTLQNIIFIPEKYLYRLCKNNNYIKFSNTLIHEKIHVFQRLNLNLWNKMISISFNEWIIVFSNENNELYNFLANYDFHKSHSIIHVVNPDVAHDFIYIYKTNNNYYYGIFNLIGTHVEIKWFLINKKNNSFSLSSVSKYFSNNNLPSEEHPFEMFAYKFADHLCN